MVPRRRKRDDLFGTVILFIVMVAGFEVMLDGVSEHRAGLAAVGAVLLGWMGRAILGTIGGGDR